MASSVSSLGLSNHPSPTAPSDFGKKYTILKRHETDYAKKYLENLVPSAVALLIASYVVEADLMDRKGWLAYFGVDIGPDTDETREALAFDPFYKYYHGPSPEDPTKLVCEKCLIPTIEPEKVTLKGRVVPVPFTLDLLEKLAIEGNGHKVKLVYNWIPEFLKQSKAERSHLVTLLKGVVARNKIWSRKSSNPQEMGQVQYLENLNARTGYGCNTAPKLLPLLTAALAHIAVTGENPFDDNSTFIISQELVELEGYYCRITLGKFTQGNANSPAKIFLQYFIDYGNKFKNEFGTDECGIGILKEFKPSSGCFLL